MDGIISTLVVKLIPLYALMALGWWAGRALQVDRESIAKIVIYILVPIIMFSGVLKAGVSVETLLIPLVSGSMAAVICLVFFALGKRIWRDATPNILALAAGTGNTGYFGLPIAMMLFDDRTVGIYILAVLGVTLFESSLGFYIAARGKHTAREAWMKLVKLPNMYAFLLGVAVVQWHVPMPPVMWDFIDLIRGAYTVLGMMIVGLGIAALPRFTLDWGFTATAFIARFVVWPLAAYALITLDQSLFAWFNVETYRALILLSLVPLAANAVVFATLLNTHPEKVASTVLLSTLLAVLYIPLMVRWLMP